MGGRSNNSSSDTTKNTEYTDKRIATQGPVATEGGSVYQANETRTVTNVLDAGAIKQAGELVGQTIAANASGQNAAYAMLGKFGRDAGELSYYTTKETVGANGQVTGQALDANGKLAVSAIAAMNEAASASIAAQAAAGRDALASNTGITKDAFAYSTGVNTNLAKTYDSALGMVKSLSGLAIDAIAGAGKKSQDSAALAVDKVASAWTSAKQAEKDLAGGDYRQLMIIGAAVIGLVAIMGIKK